MWEAFPRDFQNGKNFRCGFTQWKVMRFQSLRLVCWALKQVRGLFSAICWVSEKNDLLKDSSGQEMKIGATKSLKIGPEMADLANFHSFFCRFWPSNIGMTGRSDQDFFGMDGKALSQRLHLSSFRRQYFVTAEQREAQSSSFTL